MHEIYAHQSADGFYEEYGGYDPGYESLGIDFLARIWARTRDATLLESLRRAVEFYSYSPNLDGSLGGATGSRHTRLWFPAGFERLASVLPQAAAVAAFMRARLAQGEVVTPANVDAQNLPVMLSSYLAACQPIDPPADAAPLPCESLRGAKGFASGTHVAGTQRYYAVAALHKGGTMRVVERERSRLVYEDAGSGAAQRWPHVRVAAPRTLTIRSSDDGSAIVRASFGLVRQEQLTPGKFVVLRLLNLTLFRSLRARELGATDPDRTPHNECRGGTGLTRATPALPGGSRRGARHTAPC